MDNNETVSRLHVKRCPTGGWDAWHLTEDGDRLHVAWGATRQEAFNRAIGR